MEHELPRKLREFSSERYWVKEITPSRMTVETENKSDD